MSSGALPAPRRPLAPRTFRVFVSSTFEDLMRERDALQAYVFPRLLELCEAHGARFQAIDLRWGVSAEASLDQQAMPICLAEVARCQRISPRPNFVVLLGDRYGWRPPPAEIPEGEFEAIRASTTDPERLALLERWYVRDDNAVPAVYVLQPRPDDPDTDREEAEWARTEAALRAVLGSAVAEIGLSVAARRKYEASATEQEIENGALSAPDAGDHVFAFLRAIDGLPADRGVGAFQDLDADGVPDPAARARLESLKEDIRRRLDGHVRDYRVGWEGDAPGTGYIGDLPERLGDCLPLLEAADDPPPGSSLCVDVWRALAGVILSELGRLEAGDPLDGEIAAHTSFGEERAHVFTGRHDVVDRIRDYARGADDHPLAVVGVSGSGKSAVMAQAAQEVAADLGDALVVRFIGATPESSDGRSLLASVCREISRRFGADEATVPSDYRELVQELPHRLRLAEEAGRPLVLFLDAVDQLSDADGARSLAWLPGELPAGVRIVVSALSGTEPFAALGARLPAASILELSPMQAAEGEALLDRWLAGAGRALRPHQRAEVLERFREQGLPLYLKLAFEEARLWKSYTPAEDTRLAAGIHGIIRENLFRRLSAEEHHGAVMVARSLAYLAAAKNGLSEDEAIKLLSRDRAEGGVIAEFRRRSPKSPPMDGLPVVVWSRLYFDLEPYLSERRADGAFLFAFYHRQLREVVEEDYLSGEDGVARHRELVSFFDDQELQIQVGEQAIPNLRKLSELPYQQTMGELWDDVFATLTDFTFLERKATDVGVVETLDAAGNAVRTHTGVFQLRDDLALALERMPGNGGAPGARGAERRLVVTGVDLGSGLEIHCPRCNEGSALREEWMGRDIDCPSCAGPLRVNAFVVERPAWRS